MNRSDEELKYWIYKLNINADVDYHSKGFIEFCCEELGITQEKYMSLLKEME